jgi:hypothetical protein
VKFTTHHEYFPAAINREEVAKEVEIFSFECL